MGGRGKDCLGSWNHPRDHRGHHKRTHRQRGTKLRASNRAHLITRAFVTGILAPALRLVLLLSVLAQACAGELDEARVPRTGRRRDELVIIEEGSGIKKPRV